MTVLIRPDLRLRSAWMEVVAEFAADGTEQHGSGLWEFDHVDLTEAGAARMVDHLLAQADPATVPPEGRVHCTYFWIADRAGAGADDGGSAGDGRGAEELVGYLALRHSLTAWLLEEGGHIGYSVRPSRRREGHATRALRLAVEYAGARLALDRVLVTCDEDNLPSARTIEGGGGVFEDVRNGKRRYWIDTGA